MAYGLTVTVRKTRGDDIDAACGQLVGDVRRDRTKRLMKRRLQSQSVLATQPAATTDAAHADSCRCELHEKERACCKTSACCA